jgi:hypothetical protein
MGGMARRDFVCRNNPASQSYSNPETRPPPPPLAGALHRNKRFTQ